MQRDNGSLTCDNHEKKEILNMYFTSVRLTEIEITPDLVEKKQNKLKVSKSASPDRFHP